MWVRRISSPASLGLSRGQSPRPRSTRFAALRVVSSQVRNARGRLPASLPFWRNPGPPGIIRDRLDLAAMADDPFVFEPRIEVALREAYYLVEVIIERSAEILALGEDGAPTQSGLNTLQTQFLE